jgi:hypothetical protein
MENELQILHEFLQYPLSSGADILERFAQWNPAVVHRNDGDLREFLYHRGERKKKVLLVAHVDTVWDRVYTGSSAVVLPLLETNGNRIYSRSDMFGIGADDRAGCAMLWLLRGSGHSLLLTNGEEKGLRGSEWLKEGNPDIFEEIQREHLFVIQLDRSNASDFKCYNVGTDEFRDHVREKTGYSEPDKEKRTDIVHLCRDIPGVNLSIGYRDEHTEYESINVNDWLHTLGLLRNWLGGNDLRRFTLYENMAETL